MCRRESTEPIDLQSSVDRLERRVRTQTRLTAIAIGACALAVLAGQAEPDEKPIEHLRVRALSVVDDAGVARVVLGSPVPDPVEGERMSPSHGMVINDAKGFERFGLGLKDDGSMEMGFDAAPGVGNDVNRERINLGVLPDGRAFLRMLDGNTRVKCFLRVDDEGAAWLEFIEWTDEGPKGMRRIGLEDRFDPIEQ